MYSRRVVLPVVTCRRGAILPGAFTISRIASPLLAVEEFRVTTDDASVDAGDSKEKKFIILEDQRS